eukprot:GHVT01023003.1.p3 GENE.GHVT01023003.1~~GHVT01023003.1.p3  ORF type:complete len:144 (-),score=10.24 GHVT01023003.1:1928-2359(-)
MPSATAAACELKKQNNFEKIFHRLSDRSFVPAHSCDRGPQALKLVYAGRHVTGSVLTMLAGEPRARRVSAWESRKVSYSTRGGTWKVSLIAMDFVIFLAQRFQMFDEHEIKNLCNAFSLSLSRGTGALPKPRKRTANLHVDGG